MMESTILQLACLAVIALMAVLIYVASRGRIAALKDMRRDLDQILAGNHNIERTLADHRHVLNDAHKKIHAVSKGLEKRAS
jgi:ABC-type nickel/cobalt efflux system permease component RcnA